MKKLLQWLCPHKRYQIKNNVLECSMCKKPHWAESVLNMYRYEKI